MKGRGENAATQKVRERFAAELLHRKIEARATQRHGSRQYGQGLNALITSFMLAWADKNFIRRLVMLVTHDPFRDTATAPEQVSWYFPNKFEPRIPRQRQGKINSTL
jgi:hypothetical protein